MKKILLLISFILVTTVLAFSANKKIIVDLSKQMAYAYEGKRLVYQGWISSGQKKYPTPTGKYRVLEKDKEHVSNEWPKPDGGAKMPYMLRLTWSGIALHLGYTPNWPASHGCVRLTDGFAQKLFDWADIGTRVIITGKAPRRVARKSRAFLDYVALAKAKKRYKKYKNKRVKRYKLAKVNKKRYKRSKKRINRRAKLVKYYAKFSHKKLNRLIRKNLKKKRLLLASNRYSKSLKTKKLREINRLESILRSAKSIKYKHKRVTHHKRLAKKLHKRYKKVSLKRVKSKKRLS